MLPVPGCWYHRGPEVVFWVLVSMLMHVNISRAHHFCKYCGFTKGGSIIYFRWACSLTWAWRSHVNKCVHVTHIPHWQLFLKGCLCQRAKTIQILYKVTLSSLHPAFHSYLNLIAVDECRESLIRGRFCHCVSWIIVPINPSDFSQFSLFVALTQCHDVNHESLFFSCTQFD